MLVIKHKLVLQRSQNPSCNTVDDKAKCWSADAAVFSSEAETAATSQQ
jgi:hypothetical protein